jgi:hypothetical protein
MANEFLANIFIEEGDHEDDQISVDLVRSADWPVGIRLAGPSHVHMKLATARRLFEQLAAVLGHDVSDAEWQSQ